MSRTVAVLWLTLAATLAASWTHLAQFLARHESPGWWPVAALAATAVDLGIVAAMLAISDMAAAGRSTSGPRWTVAGLVALSCMVNAAHVVAVGASASTAELVLAIMASAALPLIVWRLSLLLDALRRPVVAVPAATPAPLPDTRPAQKRPAAARANGRRVPMSVRIDQLAAVEREFPGAPDAELAQAMNVDQRTVRRIRQASKEVTA